MCFKCKPNLRIGNLKAAVEKETGLPTCQQIMALEDKNGEIIKRLENQCILADYDFEKEFDILVYMAQRGC